MTETERLISNLNWNREKLDKQEKRIKELPIELVKQVFPMGVWMEYWSDTYQFELPMSFALVDEFKEFCKVQGFEHKNWTRHIWDEHNAGDFCDVCVSEDVYFCVSFRISRAGSTCVLKKIGEEMKPIFEAICSEGANEKVEI